MKTRLIYLFSTMAILSFSSCSDDDDVLLDTEKPSITLNDPTEGEEIAPGGEIHFDAMLTDNEELSSYKVEVHSAFDGHTHSVATKQSDDNPWSFSEVYTIEPGQTSFEAHHHIPVPAEINGQPVSQGHYHFGLFVTDAAGNEEQVFVQIHIGGEHDHGDEGDDHGDHDH